MKLQSRILVPLETWCYSSPLLKRRRINTDLGALAEALIYYDKIYINIVTERELLDLLKWISASDNATTLTALLRTDLIKIYYYSFHSTAIYRQDKDSFSFINLQEEGLEDPKFAFQQKICKNIATYFPHARKRSRFLNAARDALVGVKADEFGAAIRNAFSDCTNPVTYATVLQSFINEIRGILGSSESIEVVAEVRQVEEEKCAITCNLDLTKIGLDLGPELNFGKHTPLQALVIANRHLWSSASLNTDIYAQSPLNQVIRSKLEEGISHSDKLQKTIENFIVELDFPDVRTLVNSNQMDFKTILMAREKAAKFREWLHNVVELDRKAIIAYHHDVAKAMGWKKTIGRMFSIFGVPLSAGANIAVSSYCPPAGAVVGKGIEFICKLGAKLSKDWRPCVFGDWLKKRSSENN